MRRSKALRDWYTFHLTFVISLILALLLLGGDIYFSYRFFGANLYLGWQYLFSFMLTRILLVIITVLLFRHAMLGYKSLEQDYFNRRWFRGVVGALSRIFMIILLVYAIYFIVAF